MFWTWGVPSRSVRTLKGGGGPSNTTVIILNNDVKSYIRATCFDSTESSSGPRVSDPYEERTTHYGIPNAYNKKQNYKTNNITECMWGAIRISWMWNTSIKS